MDVLVVVMPSIIDEDSDTSFSDSLQLRHFKIPRDFKVKNLLSKLNADDNKEDDETYKSIYTFQNGVFKPIKNLDQKIQVHEDIPLYLVSPLIPPDQHTSYGGKRTRKSTPTKKSKRNKNKKTR